MITMALGLGYLWHTERLDDDKMFRMVALLQGVDLEQIAAEQSRRRERSAARGAVDRRRRRPAASARSQLRSQAALAATRPAGIRFPSAGTRTQTERFDRLARDWETKLKQQDELTTQENIAKVISDLEQVKPATAKDLLMRWIDEDRMSDVILLLGRMSETKKSKILKSFTTPEELDKLHEIHRLMIDDSAEEARARTSAGRTRTPSNRPHHRRQPTMNNAQIDHLLQVTAPRPEPSPARAATCRDDGPPFDNQFRQASEAEAAPSAPPPCLADTFVGCQRRPNRRATTDSAVRLRTTDDRPDRRPNRDSQLRQMPLDRPSPRTVLRRMQRDG